MLADYDVVDHFDVLIHLQSLLILISLLIISPWQCDQMVTLYIQPLSIYNNEHLANTIKIGQSRFKILPNMKETLENYQIFWHARQCGEISPILVALFFAFLNTVFLSGFSEISLAEDRKRPRLSSSCLTDDSMDHFRHLESFSVYLNTPTYLPIVQYILSHAVQLQKFSLSQVCFENIR